MATIRYLLKPKKSTTFSLAMKTDYLKNNSVTWLNIGKSLLHFIPLSSPSPFYPLSHIFLLQTLFISLICYRYKSSNPVVATCKYRKFFYLLFSNHEPYAPLAHLLDNAWDKLFHVPSLTQSQDKKCLVPSARFPPWKCTELSRFCCDIFSLLPLPVLLYSSGKGNASGLLLIPVTVGTRLQSVVRWRDAARGLCTIPSRLKWTGIVLTRTTNSPCMSTEV